MVSLIVILAYLSLFVELVFFPVPSVASSFNLWKGNDEYNAAGFKKAVETKSWSWMKKFFVLGLPIALIVATFFIPLLNVFDLAPDWIDGAPLSFLLTIPAVALVIIGRVICFWAVFSIRRENSQQENEFKLHSDSWYRFSRNPIQVGMYIFLFGLLLLFPSWLFLLGSLFYIFYMDYKISIEEQFLVAKFGKPYSIYQNQTKRYI